MLMKKNALILMTFLVVAGLALLACGGNGGTGSPTPENETVRTTCKPDTPPVFDAPVDLPADQKEFQAAERGYTARYPADWEARANQAAVANVSGDAFFGPTVSSSLRVNISVTCETVPVGTTSREFTDAKLEVMRRVFGGSPTQGEQTQVDGKDAYLIMYAMGEDTPAAGATAEPLNAETVQVMFADERGGWIISLLTPTGQLATYRAFFDTFVASFHEVGVDSGTPAE